MQETSLGTIIVDLEGRLTAAKTQYLDLPAVELEAGQRVDESVHHRVVRPYTPVDHDVAVVGESLEESWRSGGCEP
jgi:hypothetical protein